MANLVLMFDRTIVQLSDISDYSTYNPNDNDLLFFSNGTVRRFKKNGYAYVAIFSSIDNHFMGYFLESLFWNSNNIRKGPEGSASKSNLGQKFTYYEPRNLDGQVVLAHKVIIPPMDDINNLALNVLYKYVPYSVVAANRNTISLDNAEYDYENFNLIPVSSNLETYYNFIRRKQYLGSDGQLYYLDTSQLSVLWDVVYVLNEIYSDPELLDYFSSKEVQIVFDTHLNLSNRYSNNFGEIDPLYHNLYNEEYFARFRLQLIKFRYWLLRYKRNYNDIDANNLSVFIIDIFPVIELSYLLYNTKIKLLNLILLNSGWIIGNWFINKFNEEEAIIKLVSCIPYKDSLGKYNYIEIDTFFNYLNEIYDYTSIFPETLFEVLYSAVDDSAFFNDNGTGNLGKFIKVIYDLWLLSKFNPFHQDPIIAENALDIFTYTDYAANTAIPPQNASIAAPLILGYQSEKVLLWYKDNFNFKFIENQIMAVQTYDEKRSEVVGYYDFFQPVVLKATNTIDTIIKLPFQNTQENDSSPDLEKINNSIPIFYLKYIDDVGDYSDAKETIGAIIDVVLTFTGIGNITKLKHIRHLSKLRKLSSLQATEKILLLEGISGVVGTIEITAGVSSTIVSYVEDDCSDPEFCKTLNLFLFGLEIASLSFDSLAKRALRRNAQDVIAYIGDSPWPSSFEIPKIPGDPDSTARKMLENIANIEEFLTAFRTNRLVNRPDLLAKFDAMPEGKKYQFFYDFEAQTDDILDELNIENLLDEWDDVTHLLTERRSISFLKNYRIIKNSDELNIEIFKGRDGKILRKDATPPYGHNDYNYNAKGVHHIDALQITGKGGLGRIVSGTKVDLGPPGLGYYKAKLEVYNSEFPSNLGWKVKQSQGGYSTFFPDSWSKTKVQEELAHAFGNKIRQNGNANIGKMSDEVQIKFHIDDNNIITSCYPIF